MNNLSNQYLIKAIENYPYNLTDAIEALNFSLSYDDENPVALCLKGQFYAEQLKDYQSAIYFYQRALATDPKNSTVYPHLIGAFIDYEEFSQALKAAEFALTLKGADRGHIYLLIGSCNEHMGKYKNALKNLGKSKQAAYNSHFITEVETAVKRVKDKMKNLKKKKTPKKGRK